MLPSQRALFDMPRDVCFMNAAAWSPLPLASQEAGRAAVGRKGQPWKLPDGFQREQYERTRKAAAALIGAEPDDVALISSVGYGVSTAGKVLTLPRGTRVIVLENDHTSPVLEWHARAAAGGYTVDTVKQPADGDWTSAVLEAIERAGGAPVSLASISSVHWSDGGALDIPRIRAVLKKQGAALLVDATHDAGVRHIDVKTLDPDFLIFPTYKWVLGPYGRAFMYVAKRHQHGVPLEQTAGARKAVNAEDTIYFRDTSYRDDARRYDMGERDHFISMEMAAIGMEMMAGWGNDAIVARLSMLTGKLADGLGNLGVGVLDPKVRAPHILCVSFPKGMAPDLPKRLAAAGVHAAPRLGRLRISPHVYNDEQDVERFIEVFRKVALP
ncbi:MAG: aminotransferase class V-fold PLP-dependent enzyme [Reyranella sp.]|uniref:aminotransferase class V-fold PLP-dependent enzyme n=1 Tax=Reyranella sp. TaxID=1929291 RepID=UPI001ACE83B8|nr:aminotransferase class V-fold PLP-dependent enzyme [Reyranella sp.]MBN9085937.1 aminotransferase class V-fold PLP-dependent enzyme [Reyranella sp.]